MVVLLAAVVIGGLVWPVRLNRGGTRTDRGTHGRRRAGFA